MALTGYRVFEMPRKCQESNSSSYPFFAQVHNQITDTALQLRINAADRQIGALVRELYDLIEEKIAIVEERSDC